MTAQTRPEAKVVASGATGAATIVLVWMLGALGVEVPAEVASAITVILSAVAGYIAPHTPRGLHRAP